jgi:uncharacterized protein YeaO (DUF488 family)
MNIQLKRVYETPEPSDGTRILVERLWPRGLTRTKAKIDLWLKEIAPSHELRMWFGHDPERWEEFQKRYWKELDDRPQELAELRSHARSGRVTLVFAARDEQQNSAVALKAYLQRRRTGAH